MFVDRLNALDPSLFDHVESQTSPADRSSLLALHAAVAERFGEFSYLEIGSYKGGSLQALVADDRCRRIVSIDPRPDWQPDDRPDAVGLVYPENTAQGMLALLAKVPGGDVSKVESVELGTDGIDPESIERPDMCFVDGEHTHEAVLRDARFCLAASRGRGIVVFHDYWFVSRAVLRFLAETRRARGYLLPDSVFVVEVGVPSLLHDERVGRAVRGRPAIWRLLNAVHAVPLALRIYGKVGHRE